MVGVSNNFCSKTSVFIGVCIFVSMLGEAYASENAAPQPDLSLEVIRQSARQKSPPLPANHFGRAHKKTASTTAVNLVRPDRDGRVEEIRVYGTIDPEDIERPDKTPIQKLRNTLDKVPMKRGTVVKERVTDDGRRIAQIDVNGNRFCVEDRSGQIDFAGMGRGGMAMRLPVGKECR
jgi:hypothetical protein